MPETEPKPRLIELMGPGAGAGWKATLKNGKQVVLHEIPVPPAEAAAAVPRLQRLFDHPHPALSPVLGWGTDNNGVWVAVEQNEGTPLGSILSRGPLTPPAAASLGAAVLSGIAALHETGIAMGGFNASAVRVTSNGDVRIAGHPAAAVRGAPSQSDLRADVRSCGMAVCAAFGVDPSGAPAPPNIPPGLVVTMRSMASGAMGPSADRAQSALREMASALLAPDREVAALSELALRSGGREVPPITPFLPGQPAAAPAPAPPPAPAPAAPAPYVPNVSPGTPVRSPVSYEAPDRSVQTYPSIPAYKPTEPEPAPPEPRPSPAPVPTWADAPARTSTPAEPAAAASTTNPPATAPPAPVEPAAPRSPFEGYTPVETPASTPTPPAAEPTPPPAPTWSPVEPPVWKPGEIAVPAVAAAAAAVTPAAPSPTPPTAPPAPLPAPTRPPEPIRRPTVARPQYGGPPERPAWLIPAAVAVVVVLLLGIGGVVLANRGGSPKGGGGIAQTTPSAKTSGSPKPAGSPSPTGHAPLTVPSFGDAKNDPITKVQFCSTAAPCPIAVGTPNETGTTCDLTACTIEVAFYFSSSQKSTPVAYNLKFFDRCSGQTTDLSGPSASTSSSGYIVAIPADKWPVRIPSGVKSGALVAVASKPAVAASAPLLLGADTCP